MATGTGLTTITIQFSATDTPAQRAESLNRLVQALTQLAATTAASSVSPPSIEFANPSAVIGLLPVDGSADTAMRSDSAPPLSEGIEPVWTEPHTFTTDSLNEVLYPQVILSNNTPATKNIGQYSPLIQWIAEGWSGLKSQLLSFVAGVRPDDNGAQWVLSAEVSTSGFGDVLAIDQAGNITLATWEGQVVQQQYGGTGNVPPYAPGDILIGDAGGSGELDVEPLGSQQIQWPQIVGAPALWGEDGEDGLPGPPGISGTPGTTGATGPIGPPGAAGEDGDAGPPGPQGAQGPTGPQGPSGSGSGAFLIMAGDDGEDGMIGPPGAGSGSGTPGGSDESVQYNKSGAFAGDSNLTWDYTNQALTVVTASGNEASAITASNPNTNAWAYYLTRSDLGTDYDIGIWNNDGNLEIDTSISGAYLLLECGLTTQYAAVFNSTLTALGDDEPSASQIGMTLGTYQQLFPSLTWNMDTGNTDGNLWNTYVDGSGSFYLQAVNDSDSAAAVALAITRSGLSLTGITIGETADYPAISLDGPTTVNTSADYTWKFNDDGSLTVDGSEGTDGYVLTSGGSGEAASWQAAASPGGSNTDVQFNDDGAFGGSSDFTWSGSELAITGTLNVTGAGEVTGTSGEAAFQVYQEGTASGSTGLVVKCSSEDSVMYTEVNDDNDLFLYAYESAQFNIGTSGSQELNLFTDSTTRVTIGTDGGVTIGSPTDGDEGAGTINATGLYVDGVAVDTVFSGLSPAQGDILYYNGTNWVVLAPGTSGDFLQTQGSGENPQWSAGGSGSPGGSNTDIQFNNDGAFGGSSDMTWNGETFLVIANGSNAAIEVQHAGSTLDTAYSGPNLELFDTTNTVAALIQAAGTEGTGNNAEEHYLYSGSEWVKRFGIADTGLIMFPSTTGVTTGVYVDGGDITAARSSSDGVYYMGTSGKTYLLASDSGGFVMSGNSGATDDATALYLDGDATTAIHSNVNGGLNYGSFYISGIAGAVGGYIGLAIYDAEYLPTLMSDGSTAGAYLQGADAWAWNYGGEFHFDPQNKGSNFEGVCSFGNTLYFSGLSTGTATYAVGIITSSDEIIIDTSAEKYKTDIRGMTLEEARRILALTPIRYRDNPETAKSANYAYSYYGLLAGEAADIDPRYVGFDKDGEPNSVRYDRLTVPLIMLVNDLVSRVESIEHAMI